MNTINGQSAGMKSNTDKTATSQKGANALTGKDSNRLIQLMSGIPKLKNAPEKSKDDGNLFSPYQGGDLKVIYGAEPPEDIMPVYAAELPDDIKPVYAAEPADDIMPVYAAEIPDDIKPVYAAEPADDIIPVYAAELPDDIMPVYAAELPDDIMPVYAAEPPADDLIVSDPKSDHENGDALKLDHTVLMEIFTKLSALLSLFSGNSAGKR